MDIYLVKTDANGNVQWSKAYGTSLNEYAFGHCLQATTDGGYIITGQGGSGQSSSGIFLLKIDASGNIRWAKNYDGIYGHSVKQTSDRGFAVVGNSSSGVELIKTDSLGAVQWSKAYGGNQGFFLDFASDGGYVLGGQTVSFGAGFKDGFMIKTDSAGNSGCATSNPGVAATVAPFIAANAATLVSQGPQTIAYSLLYQRGTTITNLCTTVGIDPVIKNNPRLSIYPNPSDNRVTIQSATELGLVTVYNTLAQIVYSRTVNDFQQQIDVSGFSPGIYILLSQGERILFVKE